MYINFQSVIVDIFIIASFITHVIIALQSMKDMTPALNDLSNKGVADLIFKKAKRLIYVLLILVLLITCIITWRFYELLIFFDVTGFGLYILMCAFAVYGFTFLGSFVFCKLLLVTAKRSGL